MTKSNLAIGQTVWVKCIGDAVRYRDENDLIVKAIVEKVGNKYFYLSGFCGCKFDIAKICEVTSFAPDYQVYLSLKETKDEEEFKEKIKAMREFFNQYGKVDIALEKLRQVYDIVIGGQE